ncbi:TetR/AcrR family transcriptional regulator [Luethyella okanaganae]|uniref:TetR/AcrR family transcriptional regulator n=1 Tax=Luethyella okanaganae TaxID=69372 RepID=A0ABW1VFN9_9MICO
MSNRREQIVAAAAQIAAQSGTAALSVRAVAQKAGVGVGTLRHYFPSQKDLYSEVLDRIFDAQLDDLNIDDGTTSPARRLAECMRQFLPAEDGRISELEGWLALYTSALGRDRTDAGARLLTAFNQRARTRVDRWLSTLHTDRTRRSQHVVLLLALVDGLCLELLTPETQLTVQDARETLDEVISCVVIPSS